ncbi:MAG: hypothetical protein IPF48_04265 [Sphingomonadales bacterium]|nr:hypothetical protein [Sphingomonadales bacterium]
MFRNPFFKEKTPRQHGEQPHTSSGKQQSQPWPRPHANGSSAWQKQSPPDPKSQQQVKPDLIAPGVSGVFNPDASKTLFCQSKKRPGKKQD